jgi:LAO/AO transport system kinase
VQSKPTSQDARRRKKRGEADPVALLRDLRKGNRTALARAITLVESRRPEDTAAAEKLVETCLQEGRESLRIGITGVPGAGKSTFIEQLGLQFLAMGKRVAVLAVDPSSKLSKGSILGDKTRMEQLSRAENAFIRPSPAGESLGGVARKTRESISLCEAAGFDILLIETVGVGQSETAVHGMVDFFLLLKIAGAGDELQGIKRGIVEMADAIVINKADGPNLKAARQAKTIFRNALHLYPPKADGWKPEVLLCSSITGSGITEIREMIQNYHQDAITSGRLKAKRRQQNIGWMRRSIEGQLADGFYSQSGVREKYEELEEKVAGLKVSPFRAARLLLALFWNDALESE